jgi:alkylresorcinol/alkylpyrone synthase
MEMGFPLPMDHTKYMSVKIVQVSKQLPKYSVTTAEIMPFLDIWLEGQEDRFIRKVKKIFKGAAVDKRYSIMDPIEFLRLLLLKIKMIFTRERLQF